MEVAVQESDDGAYRPPVFVQVLPVYPPQTIISVPVQTAVYPQRPEGQLDPVDVAIQESDDGVYRPPVLT